MKRSLSIALSVVLLFSCLLINSCAEESLAEIDGLTPGEFLIEAMSNEIDVERYDVVEGIRIEAKALAISLYDAELERLYVYSYDRGNESRVLPEEALQLVAEKELGDLIEDYGGNVYFVDDYCYIDRGDEKEKYESGTSPIGRSKYEKLLINLLAEHKELVTCYSSGDGYRFTFELTEDEDKEMDVDCAREVYSVYLDASGRPRKILIECITGGFVTSTTSFFANYDYGENGELAPIVLPADADDYTEA